MAVDTSRLDGIADIAKGEYGEITILDLFTGKSIDREQNNAKAIKTLLTKKEDLGIAVDALEEITSIGLDKIRPLPPLVSSSGVSKAFWGAAVKGEEIILLVDLDRR